jgi:L-arabinose isomerase
VRYQARLKPRSSASLKKGCSAAFHTNFQDLHGLKQLPGLAVQNLSRKGYGFAAEGDWKTAALVRVMN